jgi:adenylate cyclase
MIQAMARLLLRPWRLRVFALAIAALAWAGLAWLAPTALHQADERATDSVWAALADKTPERRIVVVDIDDASIQRVGPWPWPRATQARLVKALKEQGVSLQLYDVVFPDDRDTKGELARAIAAVDTSSPVVLAQIFAINHESAQSSGQLAGALPGGACLPPAVPSQGFLANAPGLHARAGHITPRLDLDGAVRRMPALICHESRNYPALALAGLLAAAEPVPGAPLRVEPATHLWQPPWMLTFPGMPGVQAPLDAHGDLRVPYRKDRSAITSVSAADVIEGRVPDDVLRGKWALVGASAFGLTDAVPTALGGAVSGVEVHVQMLSGLLDGAVPYEPRGAPLLLILWVAFGVAALLAMAGLRLNPGRPGALRLQSYRVLWLPLAALGFGVATLGLHAAALAAAGWWLGWSHAALALVLAGLFLGLAEHARSLAEKGRLFRNLASYLPAAVAEQVALAEPSGDIVAERRDLTVVAADLRNFSAYCEARNPEDAARVLHRFYSTASAIVEAHGGVIEEMVGDGLIALFNDPRPGGDHAVRALAAAREMWLRCTEELPNVPPQGLEPLGLGIGMESGMALLGSFGAAGRRVHTVLGQTVTIALRLQNLTADLSYPVLVGDAAAARIGVPFDQSDLALKPLGTFLLPGLRHSSKIFTLRSLLSPGSPGDEQSLQYLKQQKQLAA